MSVYGITRRTAQQRKPMESALLKVAVIALLVVGIAGSSVVTLHIEAAPEPTDIEDCWAEEAIVALIDEGIITGYPDGTFKPEDPVTRAEFSKMVARAFAVRAAGEPTFSDIEDNWAKTYIAALTEAGIVSGFPDGTFRPSKDISRAEMTQ
ncbi:MAG TPA: S-layer homology domain-containing protein, partial [Firmicutes bacterium]|nr:S-layer homology domain-containing protein [Bacillota bacterium]